MMKRLIHVLLTVVSVFAVVQSCKHELPKPTFSNTPSISDSCSWDTIYFVKEIYPIFISYCTGSDCHDATDPQNGIQLTDYAHIMDADIIKPGRPDDSDIMEVLTKAVTEEDRMPPAGYPQLTPEQINAIKIWIQQGAKNNDCNNGCSGSDTTFATGVWPVLDATCRGCHSGINPAGGVQITDYSTVKTIVDNGIFEKAVYHLPGAKPMPPGGSLDSCSLVKIRGWLNAGALNN